MITGKKWNAGKEEMHACAKAWLQKGLLVTEKLN